MTFSSLCQSKPSYDSVISCVSVYSIHMKTKPVTIRSEKPHQLAGLSACLCLKTMFKYDLLVRWQQQKLG